MKIIPHNIRVSGRIKEKHVAIRTTAVSHSLKINASPHAFYTATGFSTLSGVLEERKSGMIPHCRYYALP
jgi:hypothetical protein